ncbi:hypothetical protein BD779DRAFT_1500621 [Infundibulicybe gibba]|nr:hypothetical protein BD779DRAFT_1500621 [Infundibulicybe gibba]
MTIQRTYTTMASILVPNEAEAGHASNANTREPAERGANNREQRVTMPSEVVEPTRSEVATQQASTQPGDGSEVRAGHGHDPHHDNGATKVPFKERVIGVAQVTRGTLLGKPNLKEHGEMILEGQASAQDPKSTI